MITLSVADVRARDPKIINSSSAMGQELKLVSEKAGKMRSVATFNTGATGVTTSVGWSYAPGTAYRLGPAHYQGMLRSLAQQELRG